MTAETGNPQGHAGHVKYVLHARALWKKSTIAGADLSTQAPSNGKNLE